MGQAGSFVRVDIYIPKAVQYSGKRGNLKPEHGPAWWALEFRDGCATPETAAVVALMQSVDTIARHSTAAGAPTLFIDVTGHGLTVDYLNLEPHGDSVGALFGVLDKLEPGAPHTVSVFFEALLVTAATEDIAERKFAAWAHKLFSAWSAQHLDECRCTVEPAVVNGIVTRLHMQRFFGEFRPYMIFIPERFKCDE